MGEEGTNVRLAQLEKDNDERKTKQDAMDKKIVIIEKLNIKQDVTLKLILGSLKFIGGIFATFVITNFLMFLMQKY